MKPIVYIFTKSGNPVTIVEREGTQATVERIDTKKKMICNISALVPVEKFIADGGELCASHMRLIDQIRGTMTIMDQYEREYLEAAVKWTRSRKPTRKAFYLGRMDGLRFAMERTIGEKQTRDTINLIGYSIERTMKKKGKT
jgi:hypothetical protein